MTLKWGRYAHLEHGKVLMMTVILSPLQEYKSLYFQGSVRHSDNSIRYVICSLQSNWHCSGTVNCKKSPMCYCMWQCERNIDYIICNKVLAETILDAEFKEPIDKGFFYAGYGDVVLNGGSLHYFSKCSILLYLSHFSSPGADWLFKTMLGSCYLRFLTHAKNILYLNVLSNISCLLFTSKQFNVFQIQFYYNTNNSKRADIYKAQ